MVEFKPGDRVRVLRLNDEDVNFTATLEDYSSEITHCLRLSNCSNKNYDEKLVYISTDDDYEKDEDDYYEHIGETFNLKNFIEVDNYYVVHLKGSAYVEYFFINPEHELEEVKIGFDGVDYAERFNEIDEALIVSEAIGGRVLEVNTEIKEITQEEK